MNEMIVQSASAGKSPFCVTEDSIRSFILSEEAKEISPDTLRHWKGYLNALYRWLPDDKLITKNVLAKWRSSLEEKGFSANTVRCYAKTVNRYLRYVERGDLCFTQGKAKDLTGQKFGLLTAVEPLEERKRADVVWRCVCECGNEAEAAATQLISHHVMSCGCLRLQHIRRANRYIEGTELRQSLEEKVVSTRASSGYVGVREKGGKWEAFIQYKGERVGLGTYADIRDAVRARARGKEKVQEDAQKLSDIYEELHKNDRVLPKRADYQRNEETEL